MYVLLKVSENVNQLKFVLLLNKCTSKLLQIKCSVFCVLDKSNLVHPILSLISYSYILKTFDLMIKVLSFVSKPVPLRMICNLPFSQDELIHPDIHHQSAGSQLLAAERAAEVNILLISISESVLVDDY